MRWSAVRISAVGVCTGGELWTTPVQSSAKVCARLSRIDEPWLTPQNAANMGEKADGMTHCRPETPENERRFPSKPCFRAAQCTWQPGNLAIWQLTNDQETKRETLLAHLRVERSYYVLNIILCIINFSTKIKR